MRRFVSKNALAPNLIDSPSSAGSRRLQSANSSASVSRGLSSTWSRAFLDYSEGQDEMRWGPRAVYIRCHQLLLRPLLAHGAFRYWSPLNRFQNSHDEFVG